MSTGGTLPYHLRQNKAIDRILFIDILHRINNYTNISEYLYIGFGGPFLEDFKIMHRELKIKNMISIEIDDDVYKRQLFNKPLSCIKITQQNSRDFIDEFDFSKEKHIIWLDYTQPEYGDQLIEIQNLIERLNEGDVFKFTLNANSANLGNPSDNNRNQLLKYRLDKFRDMIGSDFYPLDLNENNMGSKSFPKCILKSCENAIKKGSSAKNLTPYMLLYCSYKDGQEMVSVTGILLNEKNIDIFKNKTRLSYWRFYANGFLSENGNLTKINLPVLSVKERLFIEAGLPSANEEEIINDILGFKLVANEADNNELIKNFIDYYKNFPWFAKISL